MTISAHNNKCKIMPYVQFDGVSSYIDADYTFSINTRVECILAAITTGVNNRVWFGGLFGNSLLMRSSLIFEIGGRRTAASAVSSDIFTLEASNEFGRKVNGIQTYFNYGTQSTCYGNFFIGAYSNRGTAAGFSEFKLFHMKIFNGETLVRDLKPFDDNGNGCLKDFVSGKIFKNAGDGHIHFGIAR